MRTISDLLLNYKIPGVQAAEIRRICAEEIQMITGYTPTSKQLQYKNEQLFLTVPPIIKSALLLKHSEFSSRLASRGVTLSHSIK